jgi:hypothetical protein
MLIRVLVMLFREIMLENPMMLFGDLVMLGCVSVLL